MQSRVDSQHVIEYTIETSVLQHDDEGPLISAQCSGNAGDVIPHLHHCRSYIQVLDGERLSSSDLTALRPHVWEFSSAEALKVGCCQCVRAGVYATGKLSMYFVDILSAQSTFYGMEGKIQFLKD